MATDSSNAGEGSVVERTDGEARLAVLVAEAVSEARGVPPDELTFELNDFIDPDALDRLFAARLDGTPRHGGTVRFTVDEFDVVVDASETVRVLRHE